MTRQTSTDLSNDEVGGTWRSTARLISQRKVAGNWNARLAQTPRRSAKRSASQRAMPLLWVITISRASGARKGRRNTLASCSIRISSWLL